MLTAKLLNRISRISTLCPVRQLSVTSSTDAKKEHYDVIIAGGGLVGVSLAVSLGKALNFCFVYILQLHNFF